MKVAFTNKNGPYTFYRLGEMVLVISMRGSALNRELIGISEEECIELLKKEHRFVHVANYDNSIEAHKAILADLIIKQTQNAS